MSVRYSTRREFLALGGAFVVGAVSHLEVAAQPLSKKKPSPKLRLVYRLSCRGRRCSQFAKIYAANLRFRTKKAAERHPPHPGHHTRIVSIIVSEEQYFVWFPRDQRPRNIVDLREL
jgi:hypothetical protein